MSKVSNRLTREGKLLLNGTFDEATFSNTFAGINNLFLYTQDLSNAVWNKDQTTVTTDAAIAPDTTSTADKLIGNNGITVRKSVYQLFNTISGTKYTFSVYLKQAGFTNCMIWNDSMNASEGAYFGAGTLLNLTNGTRTYGSQTIITDAGNGWYRCQITFTPTINEASRIQISLGDANGVGTATGDGVSGIYFWGAQLEIADSPTPYQGITSSNTIIPVKFKTKSTLDKIYTTGILDEGTYNTTTPVIKNMLSYTDSMTSANGWGIGANTTFVSSATAPNGTSTANRYAGNGSGGNEYVAKQVVYEANTTYTASVWARLASGTTPTGGMILTIQYNDGVGSVRATVPYNGNLTSDWKRFSVSYTNITAGTYTAFFIADQNNTAQIDVWGSQVEKDTTVTPYQGILLNTLSPTTSSPKREGRDGTIYVKETFDEWTGAPVVDTSSVLWLDAGQEASYVGSGTTWTDLSGKGNNGTLTNSPTFNTLGYINYANNTTQTTTFANTSTLLFTETLPYTIDVWVQINEYPPVNTWKRIIHREADLGIGRDGYTFWANGNAGSNTIQFTIERFVAGSAVACAYNLPWATTGCAWNHWTIKYTGTQLSLYRNGTLVSGPFADSRSVTNNSSAFLIGNLGSTYAIGGNISSVKIYNRALNDEEILQNFNALRRRYGI